MTFYTFKAGVLLCGKIREYLESRRFEGLNIEWREGKGWIEREWIVRGCPSDVDRVAKEITTWIHSNGFQKEA